MKKKSFGENISIEIDENDCIELIQEDYGGDCDHPLSGEVRILIEDEETKLAIIEYLETLKPAIKKRLEEENKQQVGYDYDRILKETKIELRGFTDEFVFVIIYPKIKDHMEDGRDLKLLEGYEAVKAYSYYPEKETFDTFRMSIHPNLGKEKIAFNYLSAKYSKDNIKDLRKPTPLEIERIERNEVREET